MAQGKLKVKAQLPKSTKKGKKVTRNKGVVKKANRPALPSKKKNPEAAKLKKELAKTIHESMEKELRAKALGGKSSLTKKKGTTSETSKKRR
ncbi:hypothetical protein J437_LFUL003718 [Ladona fulva]|uniref:Uncharacterized protein n=1 Tax=Ladona fulva TaxID=123851 RepID=A0A8K0JXW6_LADFU|nr:hypothetical protein J437_LFUL003718 [Ladona fulva]